MEPNPAAFGVRSWFHLEFPLAGRDRTKPSNESSMNLASLLSFRKMHKLRLTNSLWELIGAYFALKSGKLTKGEKTEIFERRFKEIYGCHWVKIFPHARTGVHAILKALKLEPGDEVIMTPLTIADMINSIHTAGLKPRFMDVSLETLNVDLEAFEKAITPRSKVLLITYVLGVVPNIEAIVARAKKHGLFVIEDCSQCYLGEYRGKLAGTFGDATVVSLTNFKVVASLFGGAVMLNNDQIKDSLEATFEEIVKPPKNDIMLGQTKKNLIYSVFFSRFLFSYATFFLIYLLEKRFPGISYRLYSGNIRVIIDGAVEYRLLDHLPEQYYWDFTDIQAELGLASLERAPFQTAKRRENSNRLLNELADLPDFKMLHPIDGANNVYWRFPILSTRSKELQAHLLESGVDTSPTYLTVCSNEKGFATYHQPTPNAQYFKEKSLLFEVHGEIAPGDLNRLIRLVREFYQKGS